MSIDFSEEQRMWAERNKEQSGQKIGWSGVDILVTLEREAVGREQSGEQAKSAA